MPSEPTGLLQQKEILIQKLNFLRKELAIASDAGVKFTLQMQIRELENEMDAIEQRIYEIDRKFSDTKNNGNIFELELQKTVDIEITINRNFQEYSVEDQNKFLNAIANLLSMNSGEIKIKSIKAGSVKITLSLPLEKAELLEEKISLGALKEYNVQSLIFLKETVYIPKKYSIIKEISLLNLTIKKFFSDSIFLFVKEPSSVLFTLLLASLMIVLSVFFWQYTLIGLVTFLAAKIFYSLYLNHFGCTRCGGTGILEGDDPFLNIHHNYEEPCYVCDAKKIPPKDRKSWNAIAKKAKRKLIALQQHEYAILKEIEEFRKSVKLTTETSEIIIGKINDFLKNKYERLAATESELKAYNIIQKQAFINSYNIYLINLMKKALIDKQQTNSSFTGNSAFLQYSNIILLLQQKNSDYLHLISEPIRKDMETALNDLHNLILENKYK